MLGGAIIFLTAPPNHATKGYRKRRTAPQLEKPR